MLLLCRYATGCDKTHWHGCAQENSSDAACYAGLQLQVAKRILTAARRQFFNPTWNFLEFPVQSL